MPRPDTWANGRDSAMALLWEEGKLSASEIAHKLGLTKNQVIGKAQRMGLTRRDHRQFMRSGSPYVGKGLCCRCHEAPRHRRCSYCSPCRAAYQRDYRKNRAGWLADRLRAFHGKPVNIAASSSAAASLGEAA